ncbi:MAG: glutathione S-transferase family protein [Thermoleophilia bacterium]|nr:glutathione S-transferase family protein [Thermoleophilia bacterium]
MLLYDSAVSGNCYKVRLLLAHLGLPYERVELDVVDRSNRESVIGRERNPSLRVPTLVLDDGRALGESNAILWWLAEGTSYLPDDRFERAQVLQWQFFEQYDHEPQIAVARFLLTMRPETPDPARIEALHAGGHRALRALEAHLETRTFLVGQRYSIADIALYAYTHVASEAGFDLASYPATRAWLGRVAAQPGHVPITA